MKENQHLTQIRPYEPPKIEVVRFSCADIITASKTGDEDQGEWDPQSLENGR